MIIGLTGKAGAGKSTVANWLMRERGYKLHKFAEPLKNMLLCLGLDERHTEGFLKEAPCALLGGNSPRYAMQALGTEWGRELISPTLWIDAWAKTMPDGNVVCDDIRFDNEFDTIKDRGGIVVEIVGSNNSLDAHESEKGLDRTPDIIIYNTGTIEQLKEKIDVQGW